jgi:hypothetical protein
MADPIAQPNIDPTGQKKRSPADYIDTGKIAQALNVNMEGVPGAPKISDIQGRVKDRGTAATELGTLEDQQQRLRQSIGELESSAAYGKSIGESGVKQYASDVANDIRAGQERIKAENPLPKFIPTQENIQSLSTLFSLLGVISIGGGSKNKLSAMGALNSMTGMMKGWREGRADLWRQETVKFEKDMAQIKANLDAAAKEADLALKMLPYDVQKAEAMVQELVAKTGSQILKQKADLQGVQEAVKFVKELQTGFEKQFKENLETRRLDIQEEKMALQEKLQQQRFAEQEKLTAIREAGAERRLEKRLSEKGSGLKPGAEATKNYVGEAQLASDLKSLKDQLKDKELRKLVKDYRLESFLSEEGGKVGNQLLQTEIPSKLRKFISQAQSVRNNVYLSISGKAVTGGEAMRNYGTVPQPGDAPEVIDDKINVLLGQINNRQAKARKIYGGLPDLSDISTSEPGFNVNSIQIETPQYAPPSGPAVGSIQNGYRFKGGDPSKSDNWEKVK